MSLARTVTRLPEGRPDRICIIKPSALGDVVQTLPLLRALRWRFPEAHVSWVVNRELSELLPRAPALDEVLEFDRFGSWWSAGRLLRRLQTARFQLVFDLQGLARTGLMTWATRADCRVGLQSAREGSSLACTHMLADTGHDVPAHARYWRVAESLGLGNFPRHAPLELPAAERDWALKRLGAGTGPRLALHAGARWVTKRWLPRRFGQVAQRFLKQTGGTVVLVGSRGEQSLAEQIAGMLPRKQVLNLCGATRLRELAAVLEGCDVMLANDSGPMHLAAAMGTRVVAVFTCTSPVLSGPAGFGHQLVAANVTCAAEYHKLCPHRGGGHLQCLQEVGVDRVWSAVQAALNTHEGARSA